MLNRSRFESELPREIGMWFPLPKNGEVNFRAAINPEKIAFPDNLLDKLSSYVVECLEKISGYSKQSLDGIVVGLSGGIDSSTVAALCKMALKGKRRFLKGIILGRGPLKKKGEMNDFEYQDVLHAIQTAEDMEIEYQYLDISDVVNSVYSLLGSSGTWENSGILPRVRSLLLLQIADNSNAICAGATNGTEALLSAFTAGGPAGHFQPLVDFYKSEVYKIGEMLGVPDYVRRREPSVSELGVHDVQLYGVNCYILDPILRRMMWQKRSPRATARELGHSLDWLQRIKKLRLEGEKGRRNPPRFVACRTQAIRIKPNLVWDRSLYFDNLGN